MGIELEQMAMRLPVGARGLGCVERGALLPMTVESS